jgi:murein L,D-transpeptidase YcbB/YkuD
MPFALINLIIRKMQPRYNIKYIQFLCLIIIIGTFACKPKGNFSSIKAQDVSIIPFSKEEKDFGKEISPFIQGLFDAVDTTKKLEIGNNLKIKSADFVKDIYAANGFKSLWFVDSGLNGRGLNLMEYYENSPKIGLNNSFYHIEKIKLWIDSISTNLNGEEKNIKIAQTDIALTNAFLQTTKHLHFGIIDYKYDVVNYNFDSIQRIFVTEEVKHLVDKTPKEIFDESEPQIVHYQQLKSALINFVAQNDIKPSDLRIRDFKKDSLGAMEDVRKALIFHKYLNSNIQITDSVNFLGAFKKFQKDHNLKADALPGENTIYALTVDNYDKFQSIILSLDKWRSLNKTPWPKECIFVNIPSFELWYLKNDSLERKHNVVVGKTTNQTPEINSKLENIVLLPSWSVPQSIIKKEMMGKIKAGTLRGYKVTRHKNGWIQVVQPPGKGNSLGVIKFNFKNDHSVYIHDTPSKSLFSNDYRAYSHGCVRLKDPVDFGAFILTKQQTDTTIITEDSLRKVINRGNSKIVPITTDIQIYIRYITAMVDYQGKLNIYKDIYKKENDLIDRLFNNYDSSWIKSSTNP